ncbi:hypothetical protein [Thermococcus pacificus]|uniref:Uncharacterized protein n=1 Tax=Thermococcus pacificus TaxID=71998 RepID=A0A218P9A0_9EURY|nr:hypothetical protein [Thermococcus pacificus]ASJ07343.1 hypothetical protein A3L08_08415 [Thermococcus pacificus]
MALHSRPDGFVYDDDTGKGIIFTGSKRGSTIAVNFVAYLKMSAVENARPLYAAVGIEKLREEPSEFWTEDLLTDVIRGRGIKVHSLEIHNGKEIITATLKLEMGVIAHGRPSSYDVKELSDAVLGLIMDIVDEIIYWDHYVPEEDDFGDGLTWEFTDSWKSEDQSVDIFGSIEFWWEQFHGEEKP